jgi:hypothetical protein
MVLVVVLDVISMLPTIDMAPVYVQQKAVRAMAEHAMRWVAGRADPLSMAMPYYWLLLGVNLFIIRVDLWVLDVVSRVLIPLSLASWVLVTQAFSCGPLLSPPPLAIACAP